MAKPPAIALLLAALALTGCARSLPAPQAAGPVPALPKRGAKVYRIVQQSSQLRIRVYSTGPLASLLGHEHLVTTSHISGVVYRQPALLRSGFDLRVPLQSLVVDSPSQRRREGPHFQTMPSADARRDTRRHMLGPYELNAGQYPTMTLRSVNITGSMPRPRITVRITLHGTSHDYTVPTTVVASSRRLVVIGRLVVRQSDFGITPYSTLGGSLKVADALAVGFHFVAAPEG